MRRFSLGWISAALGLAVLGLIAAGCGSGKDKDDEEEGSRPRKRDGNKAARVVEKLKPVSAKEYGVIEGKITWKGDKPKFDQLTQTLHTSMQANSDHKYCLTGKPNETDQQEYRIGKDDGLGNVIVWIEPPAGHYFDVPKDQLDSVQKEVHLHQPHCAFLPHCFVLFPSYYKDGKQEPTGQKFVVENDATVGHNANVKFPLSGALGGGILGPGSSKVIPNPNDPVPVEKGSITISCNIHGWMTAYARAFDHPYAAVSSVGGQPEKKIWENLDSPDVGKYKITGVPVGAKVRLFAWHERAGMLNGSSGEEITLEKSTKKDFAAGK